jgi:hypothetical protein
MVVYKSALSDTTAAAEANGHVQIMVLLSPHTFHFIFMVYSVMTLWCRAVE